MTEIDHSDKELLMRAMSYLKTANDVLAFLSDHFKAKYHLGPGDQITPDGQILSVSGIQEKEKLNGSLFDPNVTPEPNGSNTNTFGVRDLSDSVAVLHGTTEDH